MASLSRRKALEMFKRLQRTKDLVFAGDEAALKAAGVKIREEFGRNKGVEDPVKIKELLKVAEESEELLRTKVVQLNEVRKDIYRFNTQHLQEKCFKVNMKCDDCTCGR